MGNVKFACQLCQSWQPEMRLDYSGTIIKFSLLPTDSVILDHVVLV
jgi:hypothetical protein